VRTAREASHARKKETELGSDGRLLALKGIIAGGISKKPLGLAYSQTWFMTKRNLNCKRHFCCFPCVS